MHDPVFELAERQLVNRLIQGHHGGSWNWQ